MHSRNHRENLVSNNTHIQYDPNTKTASIRISDDLWPTLSMDAVVTALTSYMISWGVISPFTYVAGYFVSKDSDVYENPQFIVVFFGEGGGPSRAVDSLVHKADLKWAGSGLSAKLEPIVIHDKARRPSDEEKSYQQIVTFFKALDGFTPESVYAPEDNEAVVGDY